MKRLVIAGTGSGVGKTSLTLGIIRHFRELGMKVVSFKCGPDYLDPSWHRLASGQECYNLDGWMTDKKYVMELFDRISEDYDIAIIEGVMGLFDGASPTSIEGSTAQVAQWLDAPITLICNSHGTARSLAATVKGFSTLEEETKISSVIANYCGSPGHAQILEDALDAEGLAPLAGWLKRDQLPSLPSRHLGLHSAEQIDDAEKFICEITTALRETIDFDKLLEVSDRTWTGSKVKSKHSLEKRLRLGLAKDEAFQFYYQDNLEMLEDVGFELVYFSPLHDETIPECDLLYFGGGYPEVYAEKLSTNQSMLDSIQAHAKDKRFIYAECGGLMYLSRSVKGTDGNLFPLVGILPFETEMLEKRKMLGYMTATLEVDCFLGQKGDVLRGHEFHYSQIVNETENSWEKIYSLQGRRKNSKSRTEGYYNGHILASYVHQHFASNLKQLKHLIDYIAEIYDKNLTA
ncbi:MAG: cobyrinate a,c-diamide synthase [Lentisphaeraceae bacterium]|nr:cobyrinate a,c-diamide synthase [Lentisphaeraceae bacterium]